MLSFDALIEEAKKRDMPTEKLRGILREYLQVLILKILSKASAGQKIYFTGGTYLRLIFGLKRFSEDLDFNTETLKRKEFENLTETLVPELKRTNLDCKVTFDHWQNIYKADVVFPKVEEFYGVISKYSKKSGLTIKLETNRPKWKIRNETQVISGFGEIFPCLCTDRSAFFADKIDALNKKTRGRHLYDIIFMLTNSFSIDKKILQGFGIREDPLKVIERRVFSFSKTELKRQAEALRPFLFEENQADLIVNGHAVIPVLIEKYQRK